ncbi:MAG: hypothetical protein IJ068_02505 [Bacilli bacterium]|nr:hypothetical protein [Bacilli bacterium]
MQRENINDFFKMLAIKFKTNNMGKVVIASDKIVCYIHDKEGLTFNKEKLKLDDLKENKPIYYVFDNVTFMNNLTISLEGNVNIYFTSCNFNGEVYVKRCDKTITFGSNKFKNYFNCSNTKDFLKVENTNKIIIEDFIIMQKELGFDIEADTVKINGSHIETKFLDSNHIRCNNLSISNSVFRVNDLYINTDIFNEYYNNYINANNVYIKSNNNININGVIANKFAYNNFVKENKRVNLEEYKNSKCKIISIDALKELRENLATSYNAESNKVLKKL